jgi:cell division protein FtsB
LSSAGSSRLAARLVSGAIAVVAVYYAVWGGEYSAFDLRRLQRDQSDVSARVEATRQQVDSLTRVAKQLESDPATIEGVARERFGMIREGELLYRFVRVAPERMAAQTAPALP